MQHPNEEIELHIANAIDYLSAVVNAKSTADFGELHQKILHALTAQMEIIYNQIQTTAESDQICADETTVIVRQSVSGRLYTRKLPMDYKENNNGISIWGENLKGEPANIVFLSNTAIQKMDDVMGTGIDDEPRGM